MFAVLILQLFRYYFDVDYFDTELFFFHTIDSIAKANLCYILPLLPPPLLRYYPPPPLPTILQPLLLPLCCFGPFIWTLFLLTLQVDSSATFGSIRYAYILIINV